MHLPGLFYEFVYSVDKFPFNAEGPTWVLANGDTTGLGMHGGKPFLMPGM